jgi:hypothetical protein
MKKIALLATGLLTAAFLTACGTDAGAEEAASCMIDGSYAIGCEVTVEYKGRPLNCVTAGVHGGVALSCDFVEYHNSVGATTPN